ncbi:hypothetical protein DRW48_07475 [Paracoccus suum]|uniref:L,D-TPase catalytic domain-containing protein n=1 Tax=Paracoccus suum TaxID=2259340 RepID=A0A344PJJ4_9RHOB|nr:L,D-transpeptidase family protein [Paracoccus suum]AXC49549.1 hypothetical protein DRW48_07475 [Paracoccus suum]
MQHVTRRTVTFALLALLAACSQTDPKFKTYNGPPVTEIVVNKGERRMYLMSGQTVLKAYEVGLGNEPVGTKHFDADGKTPEGVYFIDRANPNSEFHLSLGVSYPNANDIAYAQAQGRHPGGDIFIHGWGDEGHRLAPTKRDWTAGCIAVRDEEIEEVYAMVKGGVPIVINS